MQYHRLTERQKEVLRFLSGYIQQNGFPPTVREIASYFRFTGPKGAKKHLDLLEKKGFIQRLPKSPRAIELTRSKILPHRVIRIPLIGRVYAGTPGLAEENIERYYSFDPQWLLTKGMPKGGGKGLFVLRVCGESMIDAHILDGDYVVVSPEPRAKNGEIVVALIGEEATLKRFYQRGRTVHLKPANRDMVDIVVRPPQRVQILGRVVFVFRTLERPRKDQGR